MATTRIHDLMPDATVLAELGTRIARARLDRDLTQKELATRAGISTPTLKRLEAGRSTQVTNLVRVLRALGMLANLELVVPQPTRRPRAELGRERRARQRASGRSGETTRRGGWRWGDEGDGGGKGGES